MGRFVIASDSESAERIHTDLADQGFTRSVLFQDSHGNQFQAYYKKNVHYKNFFEAEDGWIIGCGTYLHPDCDAENLLSWIYKNFKDESSIGGLQDELIGQYVMIIHRNGKTFLFTDSLGFYHVYYSAVSNDHPSQNLVCSNHLTAVGRHTPGSGADMEGVYLSYAGGTMGSRTPVKGVSRLIGSGEYLEWGKSLKVGRISTQRLLLKRHKLNQTSADEIMSDYLRRVENHFSLYKRFDLVGSLNTGGLDSRTVLASLIRSGIKPILYYGESNSPLLNTQEADNRIVREISTTLDLKLNILDWNMNDEDCTIDAIDRHVQAYGIGAHEYGGCPALHRSLKEINPQKQRAVFMIGMGPAFANAEHYNITYNSIREIAYDTLAAKLGSVGFRHFNRILKAQEAEIRKFCELHNLIDSDGQITIDGDVVRSYMHVMPDSIVVNLFNDYDHFIVPFGTAQLYLPIMKVPLELRRNRWFQIELIKRMDSMLLDFDLFSGIRKLGIDKESSTIIQTGPPRTAVIMRKNRWLDGLRHSYFWMRSRGGGANVGNDIQRQRDALLPFFETSPVSKYWRKPLTISLKGIHKLLTESRFVRNTGNSNS